MNMIIKMLKDDSGAAAAEYALILAIVGTGIAFAAYGLGQSISGAMDKATKCIKGATTPTATTC